MPSWFSTTKTDPYGTLNPEQVNLNKNLGPDLTNRATGDYSQFMYPGQLQAPISQGEQDVVNNAARTNAIAGNTYNRIAQYDPNQVNEDFNTNIARPSTQNWMNDVAPYLRENLNAFSSEQGNVLARAALTNQNNLNQQRMDYQQQARTNALSALTGASNYNTNALNIAAAPRAIQQAGLDKAYNNFIQANAQKSNSINQALQFLGISTGTTTQDPTTFGNILSTAQSAANIYSAIRGGATPSAPINSGGGGGFSNTAPYGGGPSQDQLASNPNAWRMAAVAGS